MSKWSSQDRYVDEDGKHYADCDTPEQAARIVKLLNEGEADRRRLDWLDAQVKCDGEWEAVHFYPTASFTCANKGAKRAYADVREAIDAAIASESEPAGRGTRG